MKRLLSFGFFLLAMLLLVPLDLMGGGGTGGKGEETEKKKTVSFKANGNMWWELAKHLLKSKDLVGTVETFDPDANQMTLRVISGHNVDDPTQKQDPAQTERHNELKKQEQLLTDKAKQLDQEFQSLRGKKSSGPRLGQIQKEFKHLQQEDVKVKQDLKKLEEEMGSKKISILVDYELATKNPLTLRQLYLPKTDAEGKAIGYTTEEKAKLRGKIASLPGYSVEPEAFTPGRKVKVSLEYLPGAAEYYRNPPEIVTVAADPNDPASTERKLIKDVPVQFRPVVKMMVIQNEEDAPPKGVKKK